MNTMHKHIILCFTLLAFIAISCASVIEMDEVDAPEPYYTEIPPFHYSSRISLDEAYCIARKSAETTKGMPEVKIDPITVGEDTVMYMVNYSNGWSVMPADRRLPTNLITCDTGSIDERKLMANDAMEDYIMALAEDIQKLVSDPEKYDYDGIPTKSSMPMTFYDDGKWWVFVYKYVDHRQTMLIRNPMIQTKWGQNGKWRMNAPYTDSTRAAHCPTGCGPVAIAQVLYYLHGKLGVPEECYTHFSTNAYYDSTVDINGHILSENEISTNYKQNIWSYMPLTNSISTNDYNYGLVSSLMVQLGYLLQAKYTPNGTGVAILDVPAVLRSDFGISSSISPFNSNKFITQIYYLHNPIILSLFRLENGNMKGHSVVVDGYKKIKEYDKYVYKTMDEDSTTYRELSADEEIYEYISINWGYNGNGDRDSGGGVIWHNVQGTFNYHHLTTDRTYDPSLGDSYMIYDYDAL